MKIEEGILKDLDKLKSLNIKILLDNSLQECSVYYYTQLFWGVSFSQFGNLNLKEESDFNIYLRKTIDYIFQEFDKYEKREIEKRDKRLQSNKTSDFIRFYNEEYLISTKDCLDALSKHYKQEKWKRISKHKINNQEYRVFQYQNEIITISNEGILFNYNIKNDLGLIKDIIDIFQNHTECTIQYNPVSKTVYLGGDSDGGYRILTDAQKLLIKKGLLELEDIDEEEGHYLLESIEEDVFSLGLDFKTEAEHLEEFPYITILEL